MYGPLKKDIILTNRAISKTFLTANFTRLIGQYTRSVKHQIWLSAMETIFILLSGTCRLAIRDRSLNKVIHNA